MNYNHFITNGPLVSEIGLGAWQLGENTTTLAEGIFNSGIYRKTFDARNLPAGVYFYKLSSGGRMLTKKMMLIK